MTREESASLTKSLIRGAKSGAEISEAIINHFKQFAEKRVPVLQETLDDFNTPLFGRD
jgi:hypothetical protein